MSPHSLGSGRCHSSIRTILLLDGDIRLEHETDVWCDKPLYWQEGHVTGEVKICSPTEWKSLIYMFSWVNNICVGCENVIFHILYLPVSGNSRKVISAGSSSFIWASLSFCLELWNGPESIFSPELMEVRRKGSDMESFFQPYLGGKEHGLGVRFRQTIK